MFLNEKLWQLSSYIVYYIIAASILFGEHQRGGREELGVVLKTAILRQQRPVHISRVLHTYITELYDNGGFMAVSINANNDKPKEGTAATTFERNQYVQGAATSEIGVTSQVNYIRYEENQYFC